MRTYRATVRGRFSNLTDDVKSTLLAELDEHDGLQAAFTEDGTFTYDAALNAFSFRYLITDESDVVDEADGNAETAAELQALRDLEMRNLQATNLRVSIANVDDMKASTRRLQ